MPNAVKLIGVILGSGILLSGCEQAAQQAAADTPNKPTAPAPAAVAKPAPASKPPTPTVSATKAGPAATAKPRPLRLDLPEEQPGRDTTDRAHWLEAADTKEQPNRFDGTARQNGVEWDGSVNVNQDAPLTKPEIDSVEIQMKSRF